MVWKGSPHPEYRTHHELTFHRLDGPVTERFDCGEKEQNDFLLKHAWEQQQSGFSTTYLAHVGGILAAYISLALSEIRLPGPERLVNAFSSRFPALNIAQMGVDQRFAGHRIGEELVAFALNRARALMNEYGCRFLILDAAHGRMGYYARLGFVVNANEQERREREARKQKRPLEELSVSMRLDVRPPGT